MSQMHSFSLAIWCNT